MSLSLPPSLQRTSKHASPGLWFAGWALALISAGCGTKPDRTPPTTTTREVVWADDHGPAPTAHAVTDTDVSVTYIPPIATNSSWVAIPLATRKDETERAWKSASGKVTVGVVKVRLPLIAPFPFIVPGYVDEMKSREGDAALELKQDEAPGVVRFIVAGKLIRHDVRLTVRGRTAWFAYVRSTSPPASLPPATELREAMAVRESMKVLE